MIYRVLTRFFCKGGSPLKTALITGVTGQDGSFLAELLIKNGYEVHGLARPVSAPREDYMDKLCEDPHFHLHYGDMTDSCNLLNVIGSVRPDEIYNLAAQSHVQTSFSMPELTANVNGIGLLHILETVRSLELAKKCRIYQASTSEIFGNASEVPQRETTTQNPCSPYAAAKQYALCIARCYRESYGMFVSNGILFNHESERRGREFVTRKITLAAARITRGLQNKLYLGNLNALRDWGYARDYVECMRKMLLYTKPDDFIIATGQQHSVREFCALAFKHAGVNLAFLGEGLDEKGIDTATGRVLVEVSPEFFRPAEVESLVGDPSKAVSILGFDPSATSFETLVNTMMRHDLRQYDG